MNIKEIIRKLNYLQSDKMIFDPSKKIIEDLLELFTKAEQKRNEIEGNLDEMK